MMFLPLFAVPAVLAGAATEEPAPTNADLDELFVQLHSAHGEERLKAGQTIAHLPVSGFDLYVARLHRQRAVAPDTFRKLLLEIWAQVPNPEYPLKGEMWLRKPEPPWKPPKLQLIIKSKKSVKNSKNGTHRQPPAPAVPRPKRPAPHDPEHTEWLTALNDLDIDGNPVIQPLPDRVEARAQAMEAVALMRAIAATGRLDALEPLFDFAFQLDGVFRDECGRSLRGLDAQAIPGLIRRMHNKAKGLAKQRRYASYQLDRMDRARPTKAIATAPDDRVRAEIIRAYGEARAIDAVDPILGHVDSPSRRVRLEARKAWLGYVSGPSPPPSPMRKRKLQGGKEENEAKEDYLNYREMATLAIQRELAEIRGDGQQPTGTAEEMTRELFAYYDARRAAEWEAQFRAAAAKREAGDLEGAIAGFSSILAHDAFYGRRGEMADSFFTLGGRLWDKDERERAAGYLRQGVALDPDSPRARRAAAQLEILDGDHAREAGRDSAGCYRRALELDPAQDEARSSLARATARHERRRWPQIAFVSASVASAGVLLLILIRLLGMVRGRRRRAFQSPFGG